LHKIVDIIVDDIVVLVAVVGFQISAKNIEKNLFLEIQNCR